MKHQDQVHLLRNGIAMRGGTWADLLGPDIHIYSVNRNQRVLRKQEQEMQARFPGTAVEYQDLDFTHPSTPTGLDGILMVHSLHFTLSRKRKDRS